MRAFSFTVTAEDSGMRLDKFLVSRLAGSFSRMSIKRLIDTGSVRIDGAVSKPHRKIKDGEVIAVREPNPAVAAIQPEKIQLDIVYEDDALLVINKPAGMVVHPGAGNYSGTMVNALLHHCGALSSIGGVLRPGIVHRIDKGTSGIIVVAKNDSAHRSLAKQFLQRKIEKIYLAIVKGIVQLDNGTIEAPIGRSPRNRKKMGVKFVEAKPAVTHYSVIKRFDDLSMLRIRPETGRTHQIRVHMKFIGHPVLGDDTYGGHCRELTRPALHARSISFRHPVSKKFVTFDTELPDDLKVILKKYEEEKNRAGTNDTGRALTAGR